MRRAQAPDFTACPPGHEGGLGLASRGPPPGGSPSSPGWRGVVGGGGSQSRPVAVEALWPATYAD